MKVELQELIERINQLDFAALKACADAIESRRAELKASAISHRMTPVSEHFEAWEGVNQPPILSRENVTTGRQFRLSANQWTFLKEALGASPAGTIIVPYEVEFDLTGAPISLSATCAHGSSKLRGATLKQFRISGKEAEVFFRLPAELAKVEKSQKPTEKEKKPSRRQQMLLESLLGK